MEPNKESAKSKGLPETVAKKFEMNPRFASGEYHFKGRKINLDRISLKDAEDLVKEGFDIIQAKEPSAKEDKK